MESVRVSLSNHTGGSERPTVVMAAHAGIQRGRAMGRWSPFVVSLSNHMSGSERPTVVMPAHTGIQRGIGG